MCEIYDPACIETEEDMFEYLVMRYRSGYDATPGSNNPGETINDFWGKEGQLPTASADAVDFILHWEGYSTTPYTDSEGVCTVGFGHLCADEDTSKYEGYNFMDFWDLFLKDLANAESAVRATFQDLDNEHYGDKDGYGLGDQVPINQAEFDALVDFAFNAGGGNAYDLITDYLVQGSPPTKDLAAFQYALQGAYGGGGGIGIRRSQELNMFLYGIYDYRH